MRRVLQVTDNMQLGGVQSFIMNVYHKIDRSEIQFDFLIFHEENQIYEDEIVSLGGKIYKIPARNKGLFQHIKVLDIFFLDHPEYKTVHYHASSLSNIEVLKVAKKHGVPQIIMHSHNTRYSGSKIHGLIHYINRCRIHKFVNVMCACGIEAARWMFGDERLTSVNIVYNGINLEDYQFNNIIRENIRYTMKISPSTKVFACVGRLSVAKNLFFLLEVFEKIYVKQPDCLLLIIGDGELRQDLEAYTRGLEARQNIKFLGRRSDVKNLMQAVDAVIMPSIYEGFPVTLIEAQAGGIPCFFSTNVTSEAQINPNVQRISLDQGPESWADLITKFDLQRSRDVDMLYSKGFTIEKTVEKLTNIYRHYE